MTTNAPSAPEGAHRLFGERLPHAETFARFLADTGVSHGLIGPREVPILWERHILNCAVIEGAFPRGIHIVDVGSGAGLPGIALAIVRPDVHLTLIEPMQRRTEWLESTVAELGLDRVSVRRGRAEDFHGSVRAPYVTARAVARLDKLARWCFPLLEDKGVLVALKGRSAEEELTATTKGLRRLGMTSASVRRHGADLLDTPAITVDCLVARPPARST